MKICKEKTWQHETTGVDGNAILFGVNIFDYTWKNTGKKAKVKDPLYDHDYLFPIYTITIDDKEFQFACGEFSNCIYGFYVYRY